MGNEPLNYRFLTIATVMGTFYQSRAPTIIYGIALDEEVMPGAPFFPPYRSNAGIAVTRNNEKYGIGGAVPKT